MMSRVTIDGQPDIVNKFDEHGLYAVILTEARLEKIEKLARVEMGRQLIEDNTF